MRVQKVRACAVWLLTLVRQRVSAELRDDVGVLQQILITHLSLWCLHPNLDYHAGSLRGI